MDAERWERVKDVFARAVSLAPADVDFFLRESCSGDPELQAEVHELLVYNRTNSFLDAGPLALGSLLTPVESLTFDAGQTIANRFKIIRFIGSGGMGEVYEADDAELRVHIALKTVRPDILAHPEALSRLKAEVQLARRVTHPNVCRIFDINRHPADLGGDPPIAAKFFLTIELLRESHWRSAYVALGR